MKTNCNTSPAVSGIKEIQNISSSDSIGTVFYTGVPVLTINSIFTETVLYFMVINESTTYLTSAAGGPNLYPYSLISKTTGNNHWEYNTIHYHELKSTCGSSRQGQRVFWFLNVFLLFSVGDKCSRSLCLEKTQVTLPSPFYFFFFYLPVLMHRFWEGSNRQCRPSARQEGKQSGGMTPHILKLPCFGDGRQLHAMIALPTLDGTSFPSPVEQKAGWAPHPLWVLTRHYLDRV